MTPERWRTVKDVFHQASSLPPELRPALLDRKCASDPALRADIESLLATLESNGDALERSALDHAGIAPHSAAAAPARDSRPLLWAVAGLIIVAIAAALLLR